MGCSRSRDARRDIEMSPVVRQRSQQRGGSSSMESFVGLCRGRNDGLLAYSPLPLEEMAKGGAVAGSSGEGSRRASWEVTTRRSTGGERGLPEVLDDAASSTAEWPASSATSSAAEWPSSPTGFVERPSSVLSGFLSTTLCAATEETFADMEAPVSRQDIPEVTAGLVRARVKEFHEKMKAKKKEQQGGEVAAPSARRGVAVVYFTSLRGVRRTFEDGRAVRSILRCYRVRVDDRDVSMHAAFKAELRGLVGAAGLPRVFVPGDDDTVIDLGSADDVRALHEAGKLATVLARCEPLAAGAHLAPPCAGCGDMRFLPCDTCYGSRKLFAGDDGHLGRFFRRCPDCNENGLIRCPACCY